MSDNFKIKKKGERDIIPIIRFVVVFLNLELILLLLLPFTFKNLFISSSCSVVLTILCIYIIHKFSEGLGSIFSGWISGGIDRDGRFSGEIHKIKYSKRMGRFDQAIQMVNNLLHENPDNSEATLLKAQILWEGFGNAATAKKCLNRIRELAPEDDKFHRWATSYLKTLAAMEEKN